MKYKVIKYLTAVFCSGTAMWITAGLWHNLVLPTINKDIELHHEGFGIMLISYYILSSLMIYILKISYVDNSSNKILFGLKIGAIVGILWVFPHGLTMAASHGTSILYEFKNAFWHIFEQGLGGVIAAMILGKKGEKK